MLSPSAIKKIVIKAVATASGIIFIAIVAVLIISAKEPDLAELGPETPALQLKTLQIAPEDNSYGSIMDLGIELTESEREILNGYLTAKNALSEASSDVLVIINRYSASMDLFYELAKKSNFADPNYMVPEELNANTPVPIYINIRDIGLINSIFIKNYASEGKSDDALTKATQMLTFTEKARADNPSLVQVLVVNLVDRYTMEALRAIAASGGFPSSSLKEIVETVGAYTLTDKAMSDAFRSEYIVIRNMNQVIESGNQEIIIETQKSTEAVAGVKKNSDPEAYVTRFYATILGTEGAPAVVTNALRYLVFEHNFLYKPNQVSDQIRTIFSNIIDMVDMPCNDISGYAIKLHSQIPSPDEIPLTESNRFGARLTMQAYPTFIGITDRNCDRELDISSTRLALALAAYKQDIGKYPADLSTLIPKYIDKIPDDPYSHEPLVYSASQQIITSMRDPESDADDVRFDVATMQSNVWRD